METTKRIRRTPEQWQAIIESWQRSALSARLFCSEQGISYGSFCQWRRRLSQEVGLEQSAPQFIDLSTLGGATDCDWQVVLKLGDGISLTFRR